MTLEEFRNLAKSLGRVQVINRLGNETLFVETAAMATLGWPDPGHAMLHLTTADQTKFMTLAPMAFGSASGVVGKRGGTVVRLRSVEPDLAIAAIKSAIVRAQAVAARGGGELKFATPKDQGHR